MSTSTAKGIFSVALRPEDALTWSDLSPATDRPGEAGPVTSPSQASVSSSDEGVGSNTHFQNSVPWNASYVGCIQKLAK